MHIRSLLSALFFALTLIAGSADAQDSPALPNKKDFKIILLIGQSNMAGRGKPLEDQDKTAHLRVLVLNQARAWVPAVDPLHFDKPGVVGVGLGTTFGKTIADADPSVTIGLVPAAFGGSPIKDWAKGAKHYEAAVVRAKAALRDGTLAGILWHQGESDAAPEKAALYQANLDQLVKNLRAELEAADVPFIVGTLADTAKGDGVPTINGALRSLKDRVPRTGCVLAEGLTMSGDKIHFNAASYRELGRRYAAEWLRVSKEK